MRHGLRGSFSFSRLTVRTAVPRLVCVRPITNKLKVQEYVDRNAYFARAGLTVFNEAELRLAHARMLEEMKKSDKEEKETTSATATIDAESNNAELQGNKIVADASLSNANTIEESKKSSSAKETEEEKEKQATSFFEQENNVVENEKAASEKHKVCKQDHTVSALEVQLSKTKDFEEFKYIVLQSADRLDPRVYVLAGSFFVTGLSIGFVLKKNYDFFIIYICF
jgi:hypothetical protein